MKNNKTKKLNIFITGAGGFVGSAFIEFLKNKNNINIIGLEVNLEKYKYLKESGIKVYYGSTTDKELLQRIFKENRIDHIYHTAAIVEEYGDKNLFYEVNVKATVELAKLGIQHNVKSFIHLSSVMVYGFQYPFMVREEEASKLKDNVLKTKNLYCITKVYGEEELLKLYEENKKFNLVILRPGDIIGIGSVPWIIRPIFLAKRNIFAYPDYGVGILNLLYIENLNQLIYNIIKRMPDNTIKGQIFNIRDEYITVKEFYSYLFKNLNIIKFGPISLNSFIMKNLLWILYGLQEFFRIKPWVHPEGIKFLLRNNPVDNQKSIQLLNYKTGIRFYEAMEKIINYYKNQSS
ncbi:MAG: hypothetical protein KatS3mg129_1653 [Leptospiraceae bacterium]|nr:MAG: hypothetical protein KatS3mg129_1653 [Leptospiraceae bacterium]